MRLGNLGIITDTSWNNVTKNTIKNYGIIDHFEGMSPLYIRIV